MKMKALGPNWTAVVDDKGRQRFAILSDGRHVCVEGSQYQTLPLPLLTGLCSAFVIAMFIAILERGGSAWEITAGLIAVAGMLLLAPWCLKGWLRSRRTMRQAEKGEIIAVEGWFTAEELKWIAANVVAIETTAKEEAPCDT